MKGLPEAAYGAVRRLLLQKRFRMTSIANIGNIGRICHEVLVEATYATEFMELCEKHGWRASFNIPSNTHSDHLITHISQAIEYCRQRRVKEHLAAFAKSLSSDVFGQIKNNASPYIQHILKNTTPLGNYIPVNTTTDPPTSTTLSNQQDVSNTQC